MKISNLLMLMILFAPTSSYAAVEPNYVPGPPKTFSVFSHQGVDEQQADMGFINGMRPHHVGALSMSKEYLADKNSSNIKLKALAGGIIKNQTFEIDMMNTVEGFIKKPIQAESGKKEWRQVAERGLAQKQRFVRAPMPNSFGIGNTPVTKRDVEFAKAMVVHHEGALTMCHDYLKNPSVANNYLQLLCIDILTDQKQEISYMNKIISFYDGNPDDVKIDSFMVHGMDGMGHGEHDPKPSLHKKSKQSSEDKAKVQGDMGHAGQHH